MDPFPIFPSAHHVGLWLGNQLIESSVLLMLHWLKLIKIEPALLIRVFK
jgi:hypothetical protein